MNARSVFARLGIHHREHVSVARDFSIYSAVNVVSLVLLLGASLVLRRYLGPTLAGIWTALEVLPVYATYAHLGTLTAAERELPFLIGARRTHEFERLKHTLLPLTHGLGLVLAVGLTIAAFTLKSRVSRPFFIGLLVYAPLLWAQLVATFYVLLFRARKRFVELSRRQGLSNLIEAALLVGCAYTFGLYGVYGALLVAAAVQLALFHTGVDEQFDRAFDRLLLGPLLVEGLPMLAGGVAFDTIRTADRIVIGFTLGASQLGVYSVTSLICQGIYYLPNALSTVMYPRFQERYGQTKTVVSLRRFVELPLLVLSDALLAAIAVLLIVLPPAIAAYLPQYTGTIAPLRVMLVGTYFLCLTPPAGQFLLTVHKQTPALFIALPSTALALAAGYLGASRGLTGVAFGVAFACFIEFIGINAYAFSHFGGWRSIARRLTGLSATALVVVLIVSTIERFVPLGPPLIAVVGGWRLAVVALVAGPLLARAGRRLRSSPAVPATGSAEQAPSTSSGQADSVDKVRAGH